MAFHKAAPRRQVSNRYLAYFLRIRSYSLLFHRLPSQPRSYARPSWIPTAAAPDTEFCEDDISIDEIASAIKKARSGSSPSPFDGIAYTVFKKCPSLVTALHHIFNLCWVCSPVPSAWKLASIKLISKSSARSDPSSISNFRPISLTFVLGNSFQPFFETVG